MRHSHKGSTLKNAVKRLAAAAATILAATGLTLGDWPAHRCGGQQRIQWLERFQPFQRLEWLQWFQRQLPGQFPRQLGG